MTELEEKLRREKRAERVAQMKKEKERRERFNKYFKYYLAGAVAVIVMAFIVVLSINTVVKAVRQKGDDVSNQEFAYEASNGALTDASLAENDNVNPDSNLQANANEVVIPDNNDVPQKGVGINTNITGDTIRVGDVDFKNELTAFRSDATKTIVDEEIISDHIILVNAATNEIVADRESKVRINPASMTKVLTVLVAAENIDNLDDKVEITLEATDYAYSNDCSSVGFLDGEVVTVRDLFYGTILPSGGDAAYALACYVSGSQEAFVDLMNQKLKELGLSSTAHFTNCVGLYDENHYCTIYDMAIIMKAAVENDWCRDVLSMHSYQTVSTEQHPDGIIISNWFLRRIEDKEVNGNVLCAKTGFVNQSRNCAVSYYISDDGVPYICATAGSSSSWRCIFDHVDIYNSYK